MIKQDIAALTPTLTVILFADTMHALIPKLELLQWKLVCGLILLPLNFAPMRFLSYTSVIGIFCLIGIVVLVFIDGFLKDNSPGSLRDPMTTYIWPQTWAQLPLGFGLIMGQIPNRQDCSPLT